MNIREVAKGYTIITPDKQETIKFVLADGIDISSYRDEISTMEYPFFALKPGDTRIREFKNENISIVFRPAADIGFATIFDKDIWVYAISKLQKLKNEEKSISRHIVFTIHDFFVNTNRDSGGNAYKELKNALSRLSSTRIQTNILHRESEKKTIDFGLIDSWEMLKSDNGDLKAGMISITLPNWLFEAVEDNKVLKISPEYFKLKQAIKRRLYEIGRKYCGSQKKFFITLNNLQTKTGSSATKAKFKHMIKKTCEDNDLPEYKISLDSESELITFTKRVNRKKIS